MRNKRNIIEDLTIEEARLIEYEIQRNDNDVLDDLDKVLPNISEDIRIDIQNGKKIYTPGVMLGIKINEIMRKHNKNIIKLDIENIDLIQSVIEKNRYKNLLELEKKLPIVCGEIFLNPMRASRRLEKSMMETYKKLSKENREYIKS